MTKRTLTTGTIHPDDGASLLTSLLDLATAGELDLTDIDTVDIEALHSALAHILAIRRAAD